MAQLIDQVLVALVVGAAIWYTIRYFLELGSVRGESAQGCSGCDGGCSPRSAQSGLLSIQNKK